MVSPNINARALENMIMSDLPVQFGEAVAEMITARNCLETAKSNAPSLTGQHPLDHYYHELIEYKHACEKVVDYIKDIIRNENESLSN